MAAFGKVLIANRGEIAVRIAQTLRTIGIGSVAVYHADEAEALHVRTADEACEIFGETPVAAYLDIGGILEAARASGVGAVHPGYGLLAENAEFARACDEAGLTFIGPEPEVIDLMGGKVRAREFAAAHDVPVLPSATGQDGFVESAAGLGFPLVIKAAAGGGGKGMHIVRDRDGLEAAVEAAQREGARYFGNDTVYAERYLDRPRHIEVQVLGDRHGNVVHLFERECSIQRRFQKLIEEAPAPGLSADLRVSICDAAVRLARAAGYSNAGTVEFILGPDGDFYFLEMNTRLQVEHPVTEMVTGLDLVAEQVRIAAGEALGYGQDDISQTGHAIECRICAEDADQDFLPATGDVLLLRPPAGPGIRFDNGLRRDQAVGTAFDPMLAKLIAHGADRSQAIARAHAALADLVLLGVTVNSGYLRRVLAHPAFRAGTVHTHFLDEARADLARPDWDDTLAATVLGAAALSSRDIRAALESVPEPHASIGAWRN